MPIYVTDGAGVATNQAQVTLGAKNIVKVYWGSTLKFQGTLSFTLNSATDVNLQTFIEGQTAVTSSAIVVTIPSGEVIGATTNDNAALVTGDLSAYTRGVTLIVNGEIQGAGGTASKMDGGDGLGATTNLTVINNGAIRAGGGAGGNGGTGGYGNNVGAWSSTEFSVSNCYVWGDSDSCVSNLYRHAWGCSDQFCSEGFGKIYRFHNGRTYNRVSYQYERWWSIRRAGGPYTGTKGTGGTGGVGQGYNQAKTDFTTQATSGTNRAGSGGAPGAGGDWGQPGDDGMDGGQGLYYTTTTSSQAAGGTSGTSGGIAGNAIDSGTATVTLQGDGIINGQVI